MKNLIISIIIASILLILTACSPKQQIIVPESIPEAEKDSRKVKILPRKTIFDLIFGGVNK
ncbi:hypothetical protein OAA34_00475 [bacterium]|nr:hypothetical protein [bacterium]